VSPTGVSSSNGAGSIDVSATGTSINGTGLEVS
jgi:hypothetical protein